MRPEDLKFHPHEIASIMADAQSIDKSLLDDELLKLYKKPKKTDEEKAILDPYWTMSLSAGAKTFCKRIAKEFVYGYHKVLEDNKYLEKGLALEDTAIDFLSNRRFRKYVKNTERRKSEYLSGECDIYDPPTKTLDIKCSWSLDTFPVFEEDAHDNTYMWQGIAYMKLWDVLEHEVIYVMLDTPDSILPRWEQVDLHEVSHLHPALRMTSITYKRDMALESKLDLKCKIAHAYTLDCIERIKREHGLR